MPRAAALPPAPPLALWDCVGSAGEVWATSDAALVNLQSGRCLDGTGGNTAAGTPAAGLGQQPGRGAAVDAANGARPHGVVRTSQDVGCGRVPSDPPARRVESDRVRAFRGFSREDSNQYR